MNFIETYKVDHDICDKIVDIFWKYKNHHVAGKSGDGGVHKEIKDSIDLYISDKSLHRLGGFKPILIDYITKYFNKYIIKEQRWEVEMDEVRTVVVPDHGSELLHGRRVEQVLDLNRVGRPSISVRAS